MYNTQLGLAYLAQGQRPLAKRKLLRALKQAPKSARVHASMAYFFEKSGDILAAERYYQKALRMGPRRGDILHHYGLFLCRQGRFQEADHFFQQATMDLQYVQTALAFESAGMCALKAQHPQEAKRYFLRAIAHDPHLERSVRALHEMG